MARTPRAPGSPASAGDGADEDQTQGGEDNGATGSAADGSANPPTDAGAETGAQAGADAVAQAGDAASSGQPPAAGADQSIEQGEPEPEVVAAKWPRKLDVYNHSGHPLDYPPVLVIAAGGHQHVQADSEEHAKALIDEIEEVAALRGFQAGQIVFQGI
jgi:hypothetical protein